MYKDCNLIYIMNDCMMIVRRGDAQFELCAIAFAFASFFLLLAPHLF
jgi:hypothetical protein